MSHALLLSDVATKLAARYATLSQLTADGAAWTVGTDIRCEKPQPATERASVTRSVPEQCVFIWHSQGLESVSMTDDTEYYQWGIQVTVRGSRHLEKQTKTLALNTWLALHKNPPTGYGYCRCSGSGPLGPFLDDSGHPTWTINAIVKQRE